MANGLPSITRVQPEEIDLALIAPFQLGGLNVRPAVREVVDHGPAELLEPRVMKVLVALSQMQGEVVSRDLLLDRCWGGRIVSDDAINSCVSKLRKLGDKHRAFTIHTVARVGYRLDADQMPSAPARSRLPLFLLIALGAILVAGALALAWPRRPPDFEVAVRPFEATSSTPAASTLATQIGDEVTGALTIRRVNVSPDSPANSMPLLVRGSVDVRGADARASVSLEDRRAGLVIWRGQFEGASGFDSTLPQQVAAKVTSMVATARSMYASSNGKIRPEALKAYVLGMDSYRERRNIIELLTFVRSMREMAPDVPLVHAVYAQSLVEAASDQPEGVRQAWRHEAVVEANVAIKTDPHEGLGYAALSNAMEMRDFTGRYPVLQRGLRNAPLDGPVNAYAGLFLGEMGRPQEGLPFIRRGHTIDPDAAPRVYASAAYLAMAGLADEGRQQLINARRVWPHNGRNPVFFTLFAVEAMDPEEGARTIADMQSAFPDAVPAASLWLEFFDSLRCRCHVERTAAAIQSGVAAGHAPVGLAFTALSRLGRVDQALDVARRAQPGGLYSEYSLLFAPATAPMRRDRRFMDLAADLGLATYWRSTGRWPEFCTDPGLPYDCKVEASRALTQLKAL